MEQLQSITNPIVSLDQVFKTDRVSSRINKLVEIEAAYTSEDNVLMHTNAKGESQYSITSPSAIGGMYGWCVSTGGRRSVAAPAEDDQWVGGRGEWFLDQGWRDPLCISEESGWMFALSLKVLPKNISVD